MAARHRPGSSGRRRAFPSLAWRAVYQPGGISRQPRTPVRGSTASRSIPTSPSCFIVVSVTRESRSKLRNVARPVAPRG